MVSKKNKKPKYEIIFSRDKPFSDQYSKDTIVFSRISEKRDREWDDYGNKVKVSFSIFSKTYINGEPYHGVTMIGFLDDDFGDAEEFWEWHNSSIIGKSSKEPDFFTLLFSMQDYRDIANRCGLEAAREILLSMRDIPATIEFLNSSSKAWINRIRATDVYTKSFLRYSEAYYALYNAGSVLRGNEAQELGKMSKQFKIEFELDGFQNCHEFDFCFDEHGDIAKRISVIIGENGIGKSQTLKRIVLDAVDPNRGLLNDEKIKTNINRILAFSSSDYAGDAFPAIRKRYPATWYKKFPLIRSKKVRNGETLAEVLIQLYKSEETIGDTTRLHIFRDSIGVINNWKQIVLQTKEEGEYVSLDTLIKGSEIVQLERNGSIDIYKNPIRLIEGKAYPLSSGELSFLSFAGYVSLYIENGSLILMDEPETHLHPAFITRFVKLLNDLLELTGSVAVLATHSAYFVREVFTDQVHIMKKVENELIQINRPRLKTFGADVGLISFFVFGDNEHSKLAAEYELKIMERNNNWEEIYSKHKEDFSSEFFINLRKKLVEDVK